MKKVFFISTGRTATNFLASFFEKNFSNVTAIHMPAPSRHLRVLSNLYLCDKLTKESLMKQYVWSRKRLFDKIDTEYFVESNNYLHGFSDALATLYPDAIIFHIVRDPRTYIESQINFGVFKGIKGLLTNYFPYWYIKPHTYKKFGEIKWHDMTDIEKVAWRWKIINHELSEFGNRFDNYHLVRFEDIFANDNEGLKYIIKTIGLEYSDDLMKKRASTKTNISTDKEVEHWSKWDEKELDSMYEICNPLFSKYNYDK